MASCDSFLPGATFVLLNAKGGTALDDCDSKEVRGHSFHGKPNQQWKFINTGNEWAIQSCRMAKEGGPVYLSLKNTLSQNAHLAMSPRPLSWYVWRVEGGLRIGWPNTSYVVELGNQGSSEAGTQVIIAHLKVNDPVQVWHFSRVDIINSEGPPGVPLTPNAAPEIKSEGTDSEGDTL
ncbi:hypothetical protein C8Q79DRAFT_174462 [Trametes meyenii]|nr:hypothetical protein C8Q79DRAFT_174462 [Trametes meyenii]